MSPSPKNITLQNNYFEKRVSSSISKYKECLDKFAKDFDNEISLSTKSPIFLDANVLLRYYSISFTAREKLFKFIEKYKGRIIITSQVQYEFLKNREDIIQRFFEQVTNKIPKDFKSDIVNKMQGFLDQHKVVLKDYPFVEPGIEKYQEELESLLQKLSEAVDAKRKEHLDLIIKDGLLDLLNTCNCLDCLDEGELVIVKTGFDALKKNITIDNVDSILSKPNGAFPGLGDIKLKPDDPYGDYIIFHEIMKFMMNSASNAVFLTFDNTKGDWMTKSKTPHLHYTQNVYANTDKILYIVDAERTLGDLLNIDIASLVQTTSSDQFSNSITSEALTNLANSSKAFIGARAVPFSDNIIQELKLNGYNSMTEIEQDIKSFEYQILQFRKTHPNFNFLGVLRSGLRIANRNYIYTINGSGSAPIQLAPNSLAEYKKYSELIEE